MKNNYTNYTKNQLLKCEMPRCSYPYYQQIEGKFLYWLHYLKEKQKELRKNA